jgi:hypothetical protein
MTRPVAKYFEQVDVFLPPIDTNFVDRTVKYYFDAAITTKDGKTIKTRYSAINNPKKERILSRFRKRAVNCKRFNVISPEFDISI